MDSYDPSIVGYRWDDENPRYQLEPRGGRGYIELRAVRRISESEAVFVEGRPKPINGKTVVNSSESLREERNGIRICSVPTVPEKAPRSNVCSAQNRQIAEPCVCLE